MKWKIRVVCEECHKPYTDYAEDRQTAIWMRRWRKGICRWCINLLEREARFWSKK